MNVRPIAPGLLFRVLFFCMVLTLPIGCTPSAAQTAAPIAPPTAPASIRQAETLELGDVQILTYGYWSDLITDDKRAQQILQLVNTQILRQRNVSMKLILKREEIPYKAMAVGVAAGDPPEIIIRTYNDNPDKLAPSPLRLNETIDAYGPGLMSAIPANGWDRCKIGDSIVALPSMGLYLSPSLCINGELLARNGWEIPQTADDLEVLLTQAKAAGIRPLDGDMRNAFAPCFGLDLSAWGFQDDDGKVLPLRDCAEYDAWVEQMRAWNQAGYFQEAVDLSGNTIDDDNFVLSSRWWYELGKSTKLIALPLLPLGKAQPLSSAPAIAERYAFESYDKPEALVTLMDWVYSSAENHDLIARGEKGIDYELLGTSGYQLIKDGQPDSAHGLYGQNNQWELQEILSMDAFRDNRIRGCVNEQNVRKAIGFQEAALRPSKFIKLPSVTERYARPGTALYEAWHPVFDEKAPVVDPPESDYINGLISRAEYDQRRTELSELKDSRLDLLQAWLNKAYDPYKDMYVPTVGKQAVVPIADASAAPTAGET